MAFQSVNQSVGSSKKVRDLAVGEELIGYVTGFEPSLQNPDNSNILMRGLDGASFRVYTAGNIKYMIKDGKIQKGLLTKIVRLADKNVKGKMSSQFDVQQDPEQSLENAMLESISQQPVATATTTAPASAVVQSSTVKSRAEALARSVTQAKRG
jgi:hypothetical protein